MTLQQNGSRKWKVNGSLLVLRTDHRLKLARCEAPLRPRKNPASATIETILADIGTINTHVLQQQFFEKAFLQNVPRVTENRNIENASIRPFGAPLDLRPAALSELKTAARQTLLEPVRLCELATRGTHEEVWYAEATD